VLLVNGVLVAISGVCVSAGMEARMTSWEVSDPFREQCAEGERSTWTELQPFRGEHLSCYPWETFANDHVTILKADRLAM